MVAVVIKKRLFFLIILGLAGLILLFLGFWGRTGSEMQLPGVQVTTQNNNNVTIEENGNMAALEEPLNDSGSNFFIEYRLERDRTRGQQVEWLREVINNAGTADETRQKAQEHLMAISRSMEKESELENLIRAKGFADAAVMVDESAVTAVVAAASLDSVEVAAITELVARSTGIDQEKITIISKN